MAPSWTLAIARLIAAAGSSASCSAITMSGSSGGRRGHRRHVGAARDLLAQPKRRAPLAGHQVDVVEHADQPPPRIEHRQVPHAVVEHLEQRLGAGAVGRHRPRRRAHHLGQRRVRAPAPAATTRALMSRSVTMPSWSPRSTTAQVTPASIIRRAASWTVVAGSHTSGSARISSRTRRPRATPPVRARGPPAAGRALSSTARRSAPRRGARARARCRPRGCGRRACPRPPAP